MSSASDFGKDFVLIHEAVITGRKAGMDHDRWTKLAHDLELFKSFVSVLDGRAEIVLRKITKFIHLAHVWLSDNAKKVFSDETVGTVHRVKWKNLDKPLNDFEIIEKYGEDIVFDSAADLEATLVDLISKQPSGEEGDLLNNGYANIFYVRVGGGVHYVRAHWRAGDSRWEVHSYPANGDQWPVGPRVFRNCGALAT